MSVYINSIKDLPILPNSEIIELFAKYYTTNSKVARDKIINSTLRLVVKIAHRYKHYGKFDDLVQEGNIGLLKAIEKFDLTKGVPWSNYSAQWIKAYILRFAFNNQTMVKRGTSSEERKYYWKLMRARAKLEAQGKPADYESLAKEHDLTPEQVEFILSRSTTDSNLQSISPNNVEEEDSSEDILDTSSSNIEDSLIKHMSDRDIEEKMNFFVENLTPQKKMIFENRFMSENYETFAQIGERLGVTRQRVQQIESDLKKQFMAHIKM